ncbi:hypothetical protein GWK48_02150 [Metallosphaera tengchongensis]|uniref:Uncharacterized protein n=1 Tax=Metallosphaera tengchongensis TaxID=1532350 RepID=A0A6N0NRH7_9CREN|nr:hypothetical protein [Metallosphaera tengchongensis]QKQ99355.1 hypothetical protein GWK48_02150 [Metallosphaera tengchongensis]
MVRKKTDEEEGELEEREEKKDKKSKKEKYIDAEKLLDEYIEEVEIGLGLSHLKLGKDLFKEIIKEPFISAVGQVKSKPKPKTIINRLNSSKDVLMEYVAAKLVRLVELSKLTDDQLEFLVFYSGRAVVDLAPALYREVTRRGRTDLLDNLRYNWNLYGIKSPAKCPKCGFEAVMPDYSCKICGYVLSSKELKDSINLIPQLEEMVRYDAEGLKEIISSGYLYYNSAGPIPPSRFKPKEMEIYYEIVLNGQEKSLLSKVYNTHHP